VSLHPSPLEFAAGLTRGAPFPTRRLEGWRWSDLQRVLKTLPPESPPVGLAPGQGPFHGLAEDELLFVNGRGPDTLVLRQAQDEGFYSSGSSPHGEPVEPRGRTLTGALILRFVSDAVGTGHEVCIRLHVPENASATLFESYEGRGSAYFANTLIEIELGAGARLERIVRLDEPADAVSISTSAVRLSAGSAFRQTVLASGARLQRHETHVRHPGQGATAEVNGAYVLRAQRHFDLTTTVTHEGEGGTTRQLIKGVVADESRGVFQGRITVLAGADRTDARMGHHALVLSDRAEVDAKPELEIWADDVQCAHGNTVGSLDENALFYARSRGMTEAQARALLTEAFLGQAVDGIVHEAAQERARAWIAERLGA
jgi:Fe-S cluster assembly protein SufD